MARYRSQYRSSYVPRSLRRKGQRTKKRLVWNIILAIVLLYLVFAWILPGLIGGLSFLNRFKGVSKGENIAGNPTLAPPVLTIPYEATNTATIQISGYASPNTQVKVYIDNDLKNTVSVRDDGTFRTESIALTIGTNNIYGKSVDAKGTESLPSKNIRVIYNNDKPKLDLSSPPDGAQIKGDKKVTVSGNTDPADSISVNGTTVIVGGDGNFSTSVGINDGDNNISVTATNSVGNTTTITRKVTYTGS